MSKYKNITKSRNTLGQGIRQSIDKLITKDKKNLPKFVKWNDVNAYERWYAEHGEGFVKLCQQVGRRIKNNEKR